MRQPEEENCLHNGYVPMLAPIAKIENLHLSYTARHSSGWNIFGKKKKLHVVKDVSFSLFPKEILGLVGESGCGKSSLAKAILRLHEPSSGKVEMDGRDFLALQGEALRKERSKIQMVFQDPYGSLNPRMTVFELLAEPLRSHEKLSHRELSKRVYEALEGVGLSQKMACKFPHEFSGGQRQRIAIARAIIGRPKVVIADEAVSSLDVSVQIQILNLFLDIREKLGISFLFISHNLAVVRYLADRIAVMYFGRIVEMGTAKEVFQSPKHPYTKALVAAVPVPDPKIEKNRSRVLIQGELPSLFNPPQGCAYSSRCPYVQERCKKEEPKLEPIQRDSAASAKERKDGDGWLVSCFRKEEVLS